MRYLVQKVVPAGFMGAAALLQPFESKSPPIVLDMDGRVKGGNFPTDLGGQLFLVTWSERSDPSICHSTASPEGVVGTMGPIIRFHTTLLLMGRVDVPTGREPLVTQFKVLYVQGSVGVECQVVLPLRQLLAEVLPHYGFVLGERAANLYLGDADSLTELNRVFSEEALLPIRPIECFDAIIQCGVSPADLEQHAPYVYEYLPGAARTQLNEREFELTGRLRRAREAVEAAQRQLIAVEAEVAPQFTEIAQRFGRWNNW